MHTLKLPGDPLPYCHLHHYTHLSDIKTGGIGDWRREEAGMEMEMEMGLETEMEMGVPESEEGEQMGLGLSDSETEHCATCMQGPDLEDKAESKGKPRQEQGEGLRARGTEWRGKRIYLICKLRKQESKSYFIYW